MAGNHKSHPDICLPKPRLTSKRHGTRTVAILLAVLLYSSTVCAIATAEKRQYGPPAKIRLARIVVVALCGAHSSPRYHRKPTVAIDMVGAVTERVKVMKGLLLLM